MPRDGDIRLDLLTPAAKLRHLADHMETLEVEQVDLRHVHHACGAAHCAWGWGEVVGLFPRTRHVDGHDDGQADAQEDDSGWEAEMTSAEEGRSALLGLTYKQFRHCFGIGYQFRRLGRSYLPADVARHLRETATELDREAL